MAVNNVVISGNLCRAPEIRTVKMTSKETKVANFTVAVNRTYTINGEKKEQVDFVPCEVWDSGADVVQKILTKGDKILVSGSLREDKWEKDGQKHSRLKIRVSEFEKLTWKDKVVSEDDSEPGNIPEEVQIEAGEEIPF